MYADCTATVGLHVHRQHILISAVTAFVFCMVNNTILRSALRNYGFSSMACYRIYLRIFRRQHYHIILGTGTILFVYAPALRLSSIIACTFHAELYDALAQRCMSRAVLLILYLLLVTQATTQSDATGCTSSAIVKLQASLDDQARLLRCLLAGDNDSPVCASAVTCKVSSINVYAHSLHTEVCMVCCI